MAVSRPGIVVDRMGRFVSFGGAVAIVAVLAATSFAATKQGGPGPDRLRGTNGFDRLAGKQGADRLLGRGGADVLIGGKGRDLLVGGPGRDSFNMRAGVEVRAAGWDQIRARDGRPDEINCGGGYDIAILDAEEDGVYGCEEVREP